MPFKWEVADLSGDWEDYSCPKYISNHNYLSQICIYADWDYTHPYMHAHEDAHRVYIYILTTPKFLWNSLFSRNSCSKSIILVWALASFLCIVCVIRNVMCM